MTMLAVFILFHLDFSRAFLYITKMRFHNQLMRCHKTALAARQSKSRPKFNVFTTAPTVLTPFTQSFQQATTNTRKTTDNEFSDHHDAFVMACPLRGLRRRPLLRCAPHRSQITFVAVIVAAALAAGVAGCGDAGAETRAVKMQ